MKRGPLREPADVRANLDVAFQGRLPAVLRPLYEDPVRQLPMLVGDVRRYWSVAIEPFWQRLRALSMADISYRMEQFAFGGVSRVLVDLHSQISFDHDRLLVDRPPDRVHSDLGGRGLVLLPCAFSWPRPLVGSCDVAQPWLTYPPRGVADLWRRSSVDRITPLQVLLGRTRATLLASLDLPATTTQLACQLSVSPAAVNQHLKILKAAALVIRRRRGRMVLYQRTDTGTALLIAGGGSRMELSPAGPSAVDALPPRESETVDG